MKCRFMSRAFPSKRKKCEMNLEPQLEVMWEGTPCLDKTCITKSWARPAEVIVECVGMKIACLVKWSMITSIALEPLESRRVSMRSIEIEFQG